MVRIGKSNKLSTQAGVTLLELMVIVAILGILAAVSLPSMSDAIGRMSANSAARTLINSLNLARSEAIKRGQTITFCASTSGTDCAAGAWDSGWMIFIDANTDADGDTGSVDTGAGDVIIQVFDPLADTTITSTTALYQYSGRGIGLSGAVQTLKICPKDNNAVNARAIELGVSGRPRLIDTGLSCP